MKKIMFIIICLTLFIGDCLCQYSFEDYCNSCNRRCTINADSLLTLLSEGNPFHVLPHIYIPEVNTKDCYYNDSLKSFLLKFLNKDTAYQYMAELAEHYRFDNDRDIQEKYIREFLKERKQMYLLDTILKTPELFSAYFDTVFNLAVERQKTSSYQTNERLPRELTDLLAQIKWPEVYVWARQEWEEDGKREEGYCYYYLLRMHDPEVISINNNFIDKWGQIETCEYLDSNLCINYLYDNPVYCRGGLCYWGSYYYEALIHFLQIKTMVYHPMYFDEKSKRPYNTGLVREYFFHNPYFQESYPVIYNISNKLSNTYVNDKKYREKYKQASEDICDNIDMFIEAIKPYKDYCLSSELYWKQNMPYYEKE